MSKYQEIHELAVLYAFGDKTHEKFDRAVGEKLFKETLAHLERIVGRCARAYGQLDETDIDAIISLSAEKALEDIRNSKFKPDGWYPTLLGYIAENTLKDYADRVKNFRKRMYYPDGELSGDESDDKWDRWDRLNKLSGNAPNNDDETLRLFINNIWEAIRSEKNENIRALLVACWLLDMRPVDIEKMLGINESTVRSWFGRGGRNIRDFLKKKGIDREVCVSANLYLLNRLREDDLALIPEKKPREILRMLYVDKYSLKKATAKLKLSLPEGQAALFKALKYLGSAVIKRMRFAAPTVQGFDEWLWKFNAQVKKDVRLWFPVTRSSQNISAEAFELGSICQFIHLALRRGGRPQGTLGEILLEKISGQDFGQVARKLQVSEADLARILSDTLTLREWKRELKDKIARFLGISKSAMESLLKISQAPRPWPTRAAPSRMPARA